MEELDLLKQAVEDFENDGYEEWGLESDKVDHFLYWLERQEKYSALFQEIKRGVMRSGR